MSRRTTETPQGNWFARSQKGSCSATQDLWLGEEQLGKLEEEEEEPATERRRVSTDLGLAFGKKS